MGKLHELLAVEDSLLTKFKKMLEEGVSTFSSKEHLFNGRTIRQESCFQETDAEYKEFPNTTQTNPVQETVPGKLQYIAAAATEYFDSVASKDATNCGARADLELNGQVLLTNVPATTLLFIENKFKSIRNLIESIKTLDQAKVWTKATDEDNVFVGPEISKVVKVTIKKPTIVVQQTDKHPAQVTILDEHRIVASTATVERSGLITSATKSNLMRRCDEIISAAKQARQRANNIEITKTKVGDTLFNYLLK